MKRPRDGWLVLAAAAVLGAVFVYASLDKIAHPREFARIVYHYRLLGPNATLGFVPANLLAVALPWVELVGGVLLVAGLWRREAAALLCSLLLVFLVAVGVALARGIDLENCGCFSVTGAGRAAGVRLLLQDVVLLAAAVFVLLRARTPVPAALPGSGADVDAMESGR